MRDSRPIYSFPEFKEPEKKSAWEPKGEPKIDLVDHELEKAKRRTEVIRGHMSPPGALGLPPLLEAHRLKYGITDGALASQALFDRIHVFPIDGADGERAEKTEGGLYKPELTKLKDKQEGNRGVLISAGLTAMDRLMSHGVQLGDVVVTNKNVPFARRCEDILDRALYYLVMRDADLASSESLMERIRRGEQKIADMGGTADYSHQVIDTAGLAHRKKLSVYINDTW